MDPPARNQGSREVKDNIKVTRFKVIPVHQAINFKPASVFKATTVKSVYFYDTKKGHSVKEA